MTLDEIDLRRLAGLEAPERAFLSFYFSGPEALSSLKRRASRIRDLLVGHSDELEHFERSLELIERWLEAREIDAPGCVFACWVLDLCEGYSLDLPLPDYLYAGEAPYIRPLANLRDEYETFALVVVDHSGCTIHLVTSGVAEQQERVKGDIKHHVKKGGWSQKRYQRRRANSIRDFSREVADRLAELCEQAEFDRIVFVGSAQAIDEVEAELSAAVKEKSIRKKGIDLHEGDEHVLAEAFELFTQQEREAEADLWQSIKQEYLSGGLAATGATDVLEAALQGRVDTMAITREVKKKGSRCRDCEHLVHGTPRTCQRCGSRSVFTVDLIDELTRLAETSGARIDFVDPIEGLTQRGDVAALLRF